MATPEQIAADNAMNAAIDLMLAAYNRNTEDGYTVVSYVTVVEKIKFDDDGRVSDEVAEIFTNPECRLATAKGLLSIGVETVVQDGD